MYDVVITGGDGFIAKNLAIKLKKLKITFFLVKKKFGDLSVEKNWKKIPKSTCLIHLAAKSHLPQKNDSSSSFIKKNILSTKFALDYCKMNRSKMIFASTIVYGGNYKSPLKENYSPLPKNYYHLSKYLCEELCKYYNLNFGLKIIIFRIFNTYGIFQNDKYLLPNIIKQLNNKKIKLKNPNFKRDFVYIDDVIDAFILALKKKTSYLILNIGSGKSTSIKDLTYLICKVFKKDARIYYDQKNINNYKSEIYADIKNAKKYLNWKPNFSLINGLLDLKLKMKKLYYKI